MNTTQALTRLRKLLGKNCAIRDHKRPSSPEQRDTQHAAKLAANEARKVAEEALEARKRVVLAADAEYVSLLAAYQHARTVQTNTPHGSYYRYQTGTVGALFFSVVAEADNLDELVQAVAQKKGVTR